jgi:lipoyl-dependent peroxiredoxin
MFLRSLARRVKLKQYSQPTTSIKNSRCSFATEEVRKYPEELEKIIFTSTCKSTGGRVGTVESIGDSGSGLKLNLQKHVNHGEGSGNATNPEELFAAGYAACFNGAVQHMASVHNVSCGDSVTTAAVHFGTTSNGVGLGVDLTVNIQDCTAQDANKLVDLAHDFCPYSKATRDNIEVNIFTFQRH